MDFHLKPYAITSIKAVKMPDLVYETVVPTHHSRFVQQTLPTVSGFLIALATFRDSNDYLVLYVKHLYRSASSHCDFLQEYEFAVLFRLCLSVISCSRLVSSFNAAQL